MDFFIPGSYSFATMTKKGFDLTESLDPNNDIINLILYKHISLAVNPAQYYQLKKALENPFVQKKNIRIYEQI